MTTRAQVCAWIASVGLVVPSLAVAQERTEREVVDLIVREGPQARAIRAGSEVVRREHLTRLAYPNPGVSYSREGAGFTEFLQVEQTLPMFGSRDALSRAGEAATAAAEAERDARLWALRTDAASAVARLSFAQARLADGQSRVGDVERLLEILRTREQEGEGSRFDRLRAEQELRETRQLVTAAALEMSDARALVRAMLPPDISFDRVARIVVTPQVPASLEVLMAKAVATRAELRALQHAADRTTQESEAARRTKLPSPTLFGGLKRAGPEEDRELGGVFGVSVQVPLFDDGGRETERWTAERVRIEAERESIEDQIRSEVTRAFEALSLRLAAVSEDMGTEGEELVEIAAVAYREGEVGILELLDAVRTTARVRQRSIELRLDARLAQVALERAVGEVLWP